MSQPLHYLLEAPHVSVSKKRREKLNWIFGPLRVRCAQSLQHKRHRLRLHIVQRDPRWPLPEGQGLACETAGRRRACRLKHFVSKKFAHVPRPRLDDVHRLDSLDEHVLEAS